VNSYAKDVLPVATVPATARPAMHHPLFAGWGDAVQFHDLVAKDIERLSRRLSSASGLKMRQELANPGACVQSLVAMLLPQGAFSSAKPNLPGGDSSSRKGHQGNTPWRSLCGELADRAAQLEVLLALLAETMVRCLIHTGITDVDAATVATASACPTSRVAWVDKATMFLQCARNTVAMQRQDLRQNAMRPCAEGRRASCTRDACTETERLLASCNLQPASCGRDACTQTDELGLLGRKLRRRRIEEAVGDSEESFAVRTAELHAPELEPQGYSDCIADADHAPNGTCNGSSSSSSSSSHGVGRRSGSSCATSHDDTCCGNVSHASCGTQTAGSMLLQLADAAVQVSAAAVAGVQGLTTADAGVQAVRPTAHAALQVMPATVHAALQAEEPEEEPTAPTLDPPVLLPAGSETSRRSGFRAALEQEEMLREHNKQRVTALHEALLTERREAAEARARLREAEQALEELQQSIVRERQIEHLPKAEQMSEPQPPVSLDTQMAPQAPHVPHQSVQVQDSHHSSDAAATDAAAASAATAATQLLVMSARDRPNSAARFAAPQVSQPRRRAWTPSKQHRPAVVRNLLGANMRQQPALP